MAPPRTPTKLKVLRGEARPSRLNRSEPQPRGARPRMPLDMSPAAQAIWRRVVRAMSTTGVITAADADILRAYCEAASRYAHAARTLEQTGPLITAAGRGARRGELVKNPLHQIVRDNALLLRATARELGLTPAARAGLQVSPQVDLDDPVERFLRERPR